MIEEKWALYNLLCHKVEGKRLFGFLAKPG